MTVCPHRSGNRWSCETAAVIINPGRLLSCCHLITASTQLVKYAAPIRRPSLPFPFFLFKIHFLFNVVTPLKCHPSLRDDECVSPFLFQLSTVSAH